MTDIVIFEATSDPNVQKMHIAPADKPTALQLVQHTLAHPGKAGESA